MLNSVVLMGRLTAAPELKQTQSGISATAFTLAIDRGYTKPGEEKQTDFINIIAWRNTAEFVCRYFAKGQLVAVSGRLQTRKWQDKQGNNRLATEVVAQEVFFAESRKENSNTASPPPSSAPHHTTETPRSRSSDTPSSMTFSDYAAYSSDDELPF